MDHGPIDLHHAAVPELLRETAGGLGGAAKEDHSRGRPVQPMHETEKDPAGLVVPGPQPFLPPIEEGWVSGPVSLDKDSRRLEKGQEVVVLVKHPDLFPTR